MKKVISANRSPARVKVGDIANQPLVTVKRDMSLAAVGATALGGGLARLRGGEAELRTAIVFGLSGIIGALLGAWLHPRFPEPLLLAGFALLMLAVAVAVAGQPPAGRNLHHPRWRRWRG